MDSETRNALKDIYRILKCKANCGSGGSVQVIDITKNALLSLIENNTVQNATYQITDISGFEAVYVQGFAPNVVDLSGFGLFLAPDYTSFDQYHHTNGAVPNGDIVVWGGFYWENTSGGASTPNLPSEATLDDTGDFTKITKSLANGYQQITLSVTVDENFFVTSAMDERNNYVEQHLFTTVFLDWLPIDVNQWNVSTISNNKVLVCNNVVLTALPNVSTIISNVGDFNVIPEAPFNIARISQNKLTGAFSAISANNVEGGSIIYRNELLSPSAILSNTLNDKGEIQGNILSGGIFSDTRPIILAMCLDDRAKCNNNILSGDGAAIWDCHGHEETEIIGNTLSGSGCKIMHLIQKFQDQCNNNTLSGENSRIEVCSQDYGTKINGHTLAGSQQWIKQLKLTECELIDGTVAIHRLVASGLDIDLSGFSQDIFDENIEANTGFFTIKRDFSVDPLVVGVPVLLNIIPTGARVTSIKAVGALTGTTASAVLNLGINSDAPTLISQVVANYSAGQTYSGISAEATANRSLQLEATVDDITGGEVTVYVEFML